MADVLEANVAQKPKDKYEQGVDNYSKIRAFTNFLFDGFYKVNVEGELPKEGPRVLVLPHQNSLDAISLIRGIDEYLAFTYKINEQAKLIGMWAMPYIGGVKVSNSYIHFKKLFEHLDRDSLMVAFPQGVFENDKVSYVKSGIAKLAQIYEQSRKKEVAIIPAGIEYKIPKHLPKTSPLPIFKIPFPGTTAILRFASPKRLDGRDPKELTDIVMQEAAMLSKLNYAVN